MTNNIIYNDPVWNPIPVPNKPVIINQPMNGYMGSPNNYNGSMGNPNNYQANMGMPPNQNMYVNPGPTIPPNPSNPYPPPGNSYPNFGNPNPVNINVF